MYEKIKTDYKRRLPIKVSKHPMLPDFNKLLVDDELEELAGERSYERGIQYFEAGKVRGLKQEGNAVVATVRGTHAYRVKLWREEDELAWACNCPFGIDSNFCKHCVATALTWRALHGRDGKAKPAANKNIEPEEEIRNYLRSQDKDALIELLLEQAAEYELFEQNIHAKAISNKKRALDPVKVRSMINKAIRIRGFVDYDKSYGYFRNVETAIDSLEELLNAGHALDVIALTEHALQSLEDSIEKVDDSDGHFNGVLERTLDLHFAACRAAKPDPVKLAKRLFQWEMKTSWDTFFGAAEKYADVFGTQGLAEYRKLAEAEWARVPVLMPGDKDPEQLGKRFRITHIMESLARQAKDIDALVAVMERDLSNSYQFLRIAEACNEFGRGNDAILWAERGLKAFPKDPDPRIREFLAAEYQRTLRHEEALAMAWANLLDRHQLHEYQLLKSVAMNAGQWPQWKQKALQELREHIEDQKFNVKKERSTWAHPVDHTGLVEVHLWEGDHEAAWREAKLGGCSDHFWMDLANHRENEHPEDTLEVLVRLVDSTLTRSNNQAYRESVGIILRIRGLMKKTGRAEDFNSFVLQIRERYKLKRNLMKMMDAEGWK